MRFLESHMDSRLKIPFKADLQLNKRLHIIKNEKSHDLSLERCDGYTTSLPGNAFVELDSADFLDYLDRSFETRELDKMAPYLWLITTQSSSNISPLHMQHILGRSIIITQTASLHLIWYYDTIFIKPFPEYLFSYAFWDFLFGQQSTQDTMQHQELYRVMTGFARTYYHLIRDEEDFRLAVQHSLIPVGITADGFARFIREFIDISEHTVSPRYHNGELRLTRLNTIAPFLLQRFEYFNTVRQNGAYFSRFFQPLLFAFAVSSVVLSGMQVALAATQSETLLEGSWLTFLEVCKWASIATIILAAVAAILLIGLYTLRLSSEIIFTVKMIWKQRGQKDLSNP